MLLSASQRWILSLAAPLHESNGWSHEWIGGKPMVRDSIGTGTTPLGKGWGVTSRKTLLSDLATLEQAPAFFAWNLGRAVAVAGWGVRERFMKEDEFWSRARVWARRARGLFDSFESYGQDYRAGREDWGGGPDENFNYHLRMLFALPQSPWVRLPWSLPLDDAPTQIPELPFGPIECSLAPAAPASRFGGLVPRSRRERFALNLVAEDAAMKNLEVDYLGMSPIWHPLGSSARAELFAPPEQYVAKLREYCQKGDSDDLEQLQKLAESLKPGQQPEEVTTDPATQRALKVYVAEGEKALLRYRRADRLTWAARLANRGFRGAGLCRAEAWDLLLTVAREVQATMSGWGDYLAAFEKGQYIRQACRTDLDYTQRALLDDANSVFRDVPWVTDLSVDEPLPPLPRETLVASLTIYFECPRCMTANWMSEPGKNLHCEACGWEDDIGSRGWADLVWSEVARVRNEGERLCRNHRRSSVTVTASTQLRIGQYSCVCGQSLPPLEELHGSAVSAGEAGLDWQCASCGATRRIWAQSKRFALIDEAALLFMWVLPRPKQAHRSVQLACIACQAPMTADGRSRLLTCPGCQAIMRLDDNLWELLHPAKRAPRLDVLVRRGPQKLWPPKVAMDCFTTGASGVLNTFQTVLAPGFHTQFLKALPPAQPYDAQSRAESTLDLLEVVAQKGDPERLAGFPRNAAYQYAAHEALRAIDLASPEQLKARLDSPLNSASEKLAFEAAHRAALARYGYQLDWLKESETLQYRRAFHAKVRERFSDFAAFAAAVIEQAPEDRREALQKARDLVFSWKSPPDLIQEPLPRGELEIVSIEPTTRCHHCLNHVSLARFPNVGVCPVCDAELAPNEPLLRDVLEGFVFWARHLSSRGTLWEATDHRASTTYDLRFRRGAPDCGVCRQLLPHDALLAAVLNGEGRFSCPNCSACSEIRAKDEPLTQLDPTAEYLILPASRSPKVPEVHCVACGAALAVRGIERVIVCRYCGTHSCLSHATWKQIHPVAHRQALGIVVRGLPPGPRPLARKASESLFINGVPTIWI